ncbi:GMC family oxidoreductase N-terminal domain-containing protein [Gammaproteobacteria bacterium]|nr:GMC family oxidoreductase N-terminal domain-containing protein [Gammaproteobacteria bacterium]
MLRKDFKIIVVGSGPGGCVPAVLLAEKGLDVLMIEEGSDFTEENVSEFSTTEMNLKYRNAGLTAAIGNPVINYAEGNCAGGGSEINSGLFHEIPDSTLLGWEKKNSISFNRGELQNAYSQVRKDINVSYMPQDKIPIASSLLQDGSDSLGWKCSEVPRWFKYDSDGTGQKQSMSQTFIPRFKEAGGEFLVNAKVETFQKINKRHVLNVILKNGMIESFSCDYLFISGGAINTPALFLRSGIKKNIGFGLNMHPSFKFTALFDQEVNLPGMGVPVHQVKEFSPEISMGCSISSKPFLGLALNDTNNLNLINNWRNMASYYSMICPTGSGRVRLLPFFKSPFVTFFLSKEDKINIYRSIILLGKVLFESGAIELFPSSSAKSFSSVEELLQINNIPISKLNLMTIHLFSSMQMGGNKNVHPVTPEGNLWSDSSIYISDSSMLCDSPSVNPQGTIMAIARMNALNFLERIDNEI